MPYRLLDAFRATFEGKVYRHRDSSLGDFIAQHLYEDLHTLNRSTVLSDRIATRSRVLNVQNMRRGIEARRGDGTFGEHIPGVAPILDPGFQVARGPIATVEIGSEVKILAKAMIKQIDRVIGDLQRQVEQFKRGAGTPICVGIVGINHAASYTSYEDERTFPTDGSSRYRHPIQEAVEAEKRIRSLAQPRFNEFIVLRFRATNVSPFPFEWVDYSSIEIDYAAVLIRISREYDRRFS